MQRCKLSLIEEVDMGLEKRYRFRAEKEKIGIVINVSASSFNEAMDKARKMVSKYLGC